MVLPPACTPGSGSVPGGNTGGTVVASCIVVNNTLVVNGTLSAMVRQVTIELAAVLGQYPDRSRHLYWYRNHIRQRRVAATIMESAPAAAADALPSIVMSILSAAP